MRLPINNNIKSFYGGLFGFIHNGITFGYNIRYYNSISRCSNNIDSTSRLRTFTGKSSISARNLNVSTSKVSSVIYLALYNCLPYFDLSNNKMLVQLEPIQTFIRAFSSRFGPLTTSAVISTNAFKIVATFVLIPYIVNSELSMYCYQSNRSLILPGFLASLFKRVGMPTQVFSGEIVSGHVFNTKTIREMLFDLSKYDEDVFTTIFQGSRFGSIFLDRKHSKEFTDLWSGFIKRLSDIAELQDKGSHNEANAKLCDLIDLIFIDMNSCVYKSEYLDVQSHVVEYMYFNHLGLYKFRNKGDSEGTYYIQSSGFTEGSDDNNAYFIIFYLFRAEIVVGDHVTDELVPVGGGIAIPSDICIDLSGITFSECFTSLLSVTTAVQKEPDGNGTETSGQIVSGKRSFSTFTEINRNSKSKVFRRVVGFKYNYMLVANMYSVLIS
jgi:hypothetical protein